MAIAVEMPKMSDTMEEGVLVSWLAEEGDAVSAGDIIAQVETDKATMDLEVYDDGVLLKKVIGEGDAVPIGGLIAVLGDEGESPDDVLAEYSSNGAADVGGESETQEPSDSSESGDGASAEAAEVEPAGSTGDGAAQSASAPSASTSTDEGARVKASPLARRMAGDNGIDLAQVEGSGPEGRVIKRDVEAAMEGRPAPSEEAPAAQESAAQRVPALDDEGARDVRITQMRKTIARRLAQSKFTAPHFYLTREVDMAKAVATRTRLNEMAEAQDRGKVSYNDLVTKACAVALRNHPMVNSSYLPDEGVIRQHDRVHVAVAVAIDEGLITPVVRDADRKGLTQIAAETRDLAGRARDGELDPSEYAGSTFTTSNLGMFGIREFTAIINPPNACILAIGAIREMPVVEDGEVVPGSRMTLTLSCDHRVVDGATGAAFLGEVAALLEEPMGMLL